MSQTRIKKKPPKAERRKNRLTEEASLARQPEADDVATTYQPLAPAGQSPEQMAEAIRYAAGRKKAR